MIEISTKREIGVADLSEAVSRFGLLDALRTAGSVAIKPNLAAGTYVAPDSHVVSDLALLARVVEFVCRVNAHARVYICESDSTGNGFAYSKFEHLDLPTSLGLSNDLLSRIEMLDLSRDRLVKVSDGRFLRYSDDGISLYLSERLVQADFVVSLANLKTHSVTGFTGACKNLFGCLPDMDKSVHHPYIHKTIHDVTVALMPQLSIVDGFYGMDRNGPVAGRPVNSGFRIISNNPVEADLCGIRCIGMSDRSVAYMRYLMRSVPTDSECPYGDAVVVYDRPVWFMRLANSLGLGIQRLGHGLERFGHRVHAAPNPLTLIAIVCRPLLLRLFDRETLRRLNRKVNE